MSIFANDPLLKALKGGTRSPRKRRPTSRRKTLTASEKRIVNAVARRVKPRRVPRRYYY